MIIKQLEVKKIDGVQKHDVQLIAQRAMRYDSDIFFEWGTRKINAKSIMGLLSMGLKRGDKVMVIIKGDDQEDALNEISSLFSRNFNA